MHSNNLIDMGSHIMLDFQCVDQSKFNLSDPIKMQERIEDGLKLTDCTVCDKKFNVFPDNRGMTLMYLLSESHISVHTFPESSCMTIDFYNCGQNSWKNLKSMEDHLCSIFGWENCSSSILLPRGKRSKFLQMDENDQMNTITHKIVPQQFFKQSKELPLSDQQYQQSNSVIS